MGTVFAFLSVFSYSAANLFWKKAAASSDLVPGFVAQYGLVAVFSILFWLLSGQEFFGWSFDVAVSSVILGISGYCGIYAYLASSRHMPMGVSLSIAYGYVVVLYFGNAELFPASESLSISRLAIALAFFASVAAFLVSENRKGSAVLKHVWLPLLSLLSWTAYFWMANVVVKMRIASPVWSLFLAEWSIFLTALAVFLARSAWRAVKDGRLGKDFRIQDAPSFSNWVSMAVFLALWTGFLLVSYSTVAANFANTIGLFATVVTSALSAWFFNERLSRSEWWMIAVSTLLLGAFLIVP